LPGGPEGDREDNRVSHGPDDPARDREDDPGNHGEDHGGDRGEGGGGDRGEGHGGDRLGDGVVKLPSGAVSPYGTGT
jgi:hypothetical protein